MYQMLCSVIVSSQNRAYEQEQLTMVLKHSITAWDNFLVLLFVYFFGKIEIPYNLSFVAKVSKLLRPFYNVRFAKACREFEQDWRCVTPGQSGSGYQTMHLRGKEAQWYTILVHYQSYIFDSLCSKMVRKIILCPKSSFSILSSIGGPKWSTKATNSNKYLNFVQWVSIFNKSFKFCQGIITSLFVMLSVCCVWLDPDNHHLLPHYLSVLALGKIEG